jgi:hypothetical protein
MGKMHCRSGIAALFRYNETDLIGDWIRSENRLSAPAATQSGCAD